MLVAAVILAAALPAAPPPRSASAPAQLAPEATSLRRGDAYWHLMSARLALSEGRVQDVVKEVQDAVALLPDNADLQAEGAGLLLIVGRRSEAERLARRALEIAPSHKTATRVLADLAASRAFSASSDAAGRAEAIRLYEKIAKDDPNAADVLVLLVRLKSLAGDGDGAVEAARRFAAVRAGDPNAVRLLSQALLGSGRRAEAVEVLVDWLRRNPDDEDAVPLLAEIARDLEDGELSAWEKIAPVLDRVVEAQPDNPVPRLLRGEALLRTGRAREAIADLEAARDGGRGGPPARAQLCTAYLAAGRLADAAEEARSLVRDFPDNAAVRSLYGDALSRQGDLEGAVEAYDLALRSLPRGDAEGTERRDDLRRRIADIHLARKSPADAAKALSGLEKPDAPESLEIRARVALRENDASSARSLAVKLRDAKETGAAAMIEGEALAREGKVDAATARFREAIAALGPGARGQAATILRETGHVPLGEDLLRAWAKEHPDDAMGRFRLGSFLERTGRFALAEPELREAIRLDGEFAEALNYLGYALIDRNEKVDEGLGMVRRALELDPDNGAYLDSLGWGLFRLGRYEEARTPLEKAAREFPRDATVLDHLGDLYDRLGDRRRAEDTWRRALDAGPDDRAPIERKLAATRPAAEQS